MAIKESWQFYVPYVLILALILRAGAAIPAMNLQSNSIAVNHGKDLLEFLPQDAILIGDNDNDLMPTVYLAAVHKVRRDVPILNMSNGTKWYYENLRLLYPHLLWPSYSQKYLLSLVRSELDGGRPIFFSNNFAALTFVRFVTYGKQLAILPRLGAYQIVKIQESDKIPMGPEPKFNFQPKVYTFALRGTEVDLMGGRADYHLQRALLFQARGQTQLAQQECNLGLAYPQLGDSEFNRAILHGLTSCNSKPIRH